jgi:membrane protein YdbS with pleckstrin-like domain
MKPNLMRYKVTRITFWIGAIVALGLRYATGGTTWPLIAIVASLAIGLVIDLVIRKA